MSLIESSVDKVPGPRVQDRLGQVSEIRYTDEGENKTFRTQQSMMSIHQRREATNWGKSQNGYLGGGNYEDNPDLNQLSIRRYQLMKDQGQLSKITKLEELEQAKS